MAYTNANYSEVCAKPFRIRLTGTNLTGIDGKHGIAKSRFATAAAAFEEIATLLEFDPSVESAEVFRDSTTDPGMEWTVFPFFGAGVGKGYRSRIDNVAEAKEAAEAETAKEAAAAARTAGF